MHRRSTALSTHPRRLLLAAAIALAALALGHRRAAAQFEPGAEVALWSPSHKTFVRMDAAGTMGINPTAYADPAVIVGLRSMTDERFRVVTAPGGAIALYHPAHGRFVRLSKTVHSGPVVDGLAAPAGYESLTVVGKGSTVKLRGAASGFELMTDGTALRAYKPGSPITSKAWLEFRIVTTRAAPVAAPPGWEVSLGQRGRPAILLVHGLAASSFHFTNPLRAWNVEHTHYDHDRPVRAATGTSDLPKIGLLAVEGSQNDPQSNPENSMWSYLVDQGFTVATWDQTPCIEATAMPSPACLDSDTFDRAYASAPQALAKLASVTDEDIVLVGHSRGGLVVRRLLKDPAVATLRSRIKTAITIHTPHQGTSLAGKGVELQTLFGTLQTKVTAAVPAEVADVVTPKLSALLGTPNAIIERLVTTVGLSGARELAPGGAIYAALTAGETKPAGIKVYTFGGTSVNVWRLHAWIFTATSAVPANGYTANPTELVALPDAFPAAFDELKPGVGDLLVTDASARLSWADAHFTNALNHGEVLWSRKVHRKVHELVLGITLPRERSTVTAYAPAVTGSAADILAEVKKLPVFGQLAGSVQAIASGDGFRLDASATGVTLDAFAGPGNWHVAAGFDNPTLFTMGDQLREHLGDVTVDSVAVVVSPAAESVPVADLPATLATRVAGWTGGGALELRAGVNVFASVRPSDGGLVGVLKNGLGLGSGAIRISGSLGPELLYRSLRAAGVPLTGSEPAATTAMQLTLALPRITPPPFNATRNKDVMHLELDDVELSLERAGGTISIGGSFRGEAWVLGQAIAIPAVRVTYARPSGGAATITVEGSVASTLDPFGIGLPLRSLGVKGSFTTGAGGAMSLGLSAGVQVKDQVAEGTFKIATSGSAIDDVSITVSDLVLADLGLGTIPVIKDITIKGAALGLKPSTKEAYIAGGIEWPGRITATGVLYARKRPGSTGFALFAEAKNVDLKTLLALPAPVQAIPLPDLTFIASSIPLTNVPLTDLPAAASAMVDDVASSGKVTFAQGLALVGKLDFTKPPFADLGGKLGVSGTMTVTGAVSGLTTGKPTFSLEVAAPTFDLPRPLKDLVLSVTPRLFLGLTQTATGPEVAIGLSGDFKLNPTPFGGSDLTLRGKTYVVIGASGVGAKLTGQLLGAWKNPFGLTGIQIGEAETPATVSFGVTASLAFDVGLGGVIIFEPDAKTPLRFKAEGVMKAQITAALGIPVITGLGINLEASELGPLTPLKIGQTVVTSVASRALSAGISVPGLTATTLDNVKSFDLVKRVQKALPLADVRLRGVELFLCTPGLTHPDFPGFSGFGVKAKGTLTYGTTDLATFDGGLNETGFWLKTSTKKDLELGPLTINEAELDMAAKISLTETPYFKLKGKLTLFTATAEVAVTLSLKEIASSFKLTLGKLDVVEVGLKSVGGAIPTDLKLTLVVDVQKLVDDLAAGVTTLLDAGPGKALRDGKAAADADVATKQQAYDDAVASAETDRKAAMSAVTRAQRDLDALELRNNTLSSRTTTAQRNLDAALTILDLVAAARYGSQLAAYEIERTSLAGLITAARAALTVAQQNAPSWFPTRMHPLVIAAQADLDAAKVAREIVLAGIEGLGTVQSAVTSLQNALTAANPLKSFKLVDASLAGALRGEPQAFEVKLVLNGKEVIVRPAYDLRDPSKITLDSVNNGVYAGAGGVPDQAAIDARLAKISLGFGDVRFYKDLKRDGTNSSATHWITDKKIGAAGWGELAFVTGGSGGVVHGITWDKKLIQIRDLMRDGTAGWEGPKVLRELDWTVRDIYGGWNGYQGTNITGQLRWQAPSGMIYEVRDFDTNVDRRGRGKWTRVFGGHDHVTYAIDWSGNLHCFKFRIDPATNLPLQPALDGGNRPIVRQIATGWGHYTHVFGGQDGIIYTVDPQGELRYHKHTGRGTPTSASTDICKASWGPNSGNVIATGLGNVRQMIGGDDGVMYAIPYQPVELTPGTEVALYSPAAQRFLRANDGFVDGSDLQRASGLRPPGWTWEVWKVVAAPGGRIALWSKQRNKFLRMNDQGQIDLSPPRPDAILPSDYTWERFEAQPVGPGRFILYSHHWARSVALRDDDAIASPPLLGGHKQHEHLVQLNGYAYDVFEVVPLR